MVTITIPHQNLGICLATRNSPNDSQPLNWTHVYEQLLAPTIRDFRARATTQFAGLTGSP